MRYEHGKVVPHLTVAERVARDKAARREVPRSGHAGFTPGVHRPDPGGTAGTASRDPGARARPDPLRPDAGVGVHLLSGAALIMASDLAGTPRSGITTQVLSDRDRTGITRAQTLDRLAEHRHEIATDTPRVVSHFTLDSGERARIDALCTDRCPTTRRRKLDVPADGGRTGNRLLLGPKFDLS